MLEFREIFLQPVLNIRMRMHTAGTEQERVYRIEESDHIDPFHDLRFEVFADGDDLSIDHKGVILDVFDLLRLTIKDRWTFMNALLVILLSMALSVLSVR